MYNQEEMIELTRKLVSIESTNVGCYEKAIGDYVYDWVARETGAKVIREEVLENRFNVLAFLPGEIDDPAFVLSGHMDTVPIGEGWEHDPLGCEIVGDKMFGRGAGDMKSGLAMAMLIFREVARSGKKLKHTLMLAATCDEEDVMRGSMKMVEDGYATSKTWFMDLDSVDEKIAMGHKGKCWYNITAHGKSCHSSWPWKGIDAIAGISEVVRGIRKRIALYPVDPDFGPSTVCFGTIQGGTNTNVVSAEATLSIDVRLAPPLTEERCHQVIEAAIADAEREIEGLKVTYDCFASKPYVNLNHDSELLHTLQKVIFELEGKKKEPQIFTGYTDSGVVAAMTGNNNCMSYGVSGGGYHQPNEWVSIASMERAYNVVYKTVQEMIF